MRSSRCASTSRCDAALHRGHKQGGLNGVADERVAHATRGRRERGRLQQPALVDPARASQTGDTDLVLGQRAGLVGADHRRLTEGLDRIQLPNEGAAPRHRPGTERQRGGHRRRKSFRNRGNRNRDGSQEGLVPLSAPREDRSAEHHGDEPATTIWRAS